MWVRGEIIGCLCGSHSLSARRGQRGLLLVVIVFVYSCISVFVNLLLSKIIVGAGRSGSSTGRRWPLLVVEWSRQWSEAPPVAGGSPPSAQWSKVLQVHISENPTNRNTWLLTAAESCDIIEWPTKWDISFVTSEENGCYCQRPPWSRLLAGWLYKPFPE